MRLLTRLVRALIPASVLGLVCVAIAYAGWGGTDPAKNFPAGQLPPACNSAPTGKECVDAAVYYLDKARAKLGEPPYQLPADFSSLGAAKQLFILTNLDRIQYGLPPITGLTASLNHDAYATGIAAVNDPEPTAQTDEIAEYTSNWAGGYENAPLAYEAWMYDDGLGSVNLDCTPSHRAGCWGHRHDILWAFDRTDVLAMGAASGSDSSYALLLVGGFPADPSWDDPGYTPTYSYTWAQAVADGAGTNTYDPGSPQTQVCAVPVVVGVGLTAAKHVIARRDCAVGVVLHRHARHARGVVLQQHPAPGSTFAPGTKIRLTVSLGPGH